jgi:hypothetical protein
MILTPEVFRRRRPTPFELLAREDPRIVDSRPDWVRGLLMMLAAVLALGWIDANDNALYERERAVQASEVSSAWMGRANKAETTAAVRLVDGPEGFNCQLYNIQREWELVVAAECKRLAGILRTARGTP